jgi:hypothetical protein
MFTPFVAFLIGLFLGVTLGVGIIGLFRYMKDT